MSGSQQAHFVFCIYICRSHYDLPSLPASARGWTLRSQCQGFSSKRGCRVWFPEAQVLIGWQVLQSVQFVDVAKTTPWNDALSQASLNDSSLFLFWSSCLLGRLFLLPFLLKIISINNTYKDWWAGLMRVPLISARRGCIGGVKNIQTLKANPSSTLILPPIYPAGAKLAARLLWCICECRGNTCPHPGTSWNRRTVFPAHRRWLCPRQASLKIHAADTKVKVLCLRVVGNSHMYATLLAVTDRQQNSIF